MCIRDRGNEFIFKRAEIGEGSRAVDWKVNDIRIEIRPLLYVPSEKTTDADDVTRAPDELGTSFTGEDTAGTKRQVPRCDYEIDDASRRFAQSSFELKLSGIR